MKFYCRRKGQATLWIILAIVLLAAILLFFFLFNSEPSLIMPDGTSVANPQQYIEECISQELYETIDILLPRGGFVAPKNYKIYRGIPIEYLCEHEGFYAPCIMQHPMLLREIEEQLETQTHIATSECFAQLRREISARGGAMTYDSFSYELDLDPDVVRVTVFTDATVTLHDLTARYHQFNVNIKTPLYNLVSIALEIAAQESKYCYFEYVGYSITYPRYRVTKDALSDPTKFYLIHDTKTAQNMTIAIRSCAYPGGI
jgi:hypothetical protein